MYRSIDYFFMKNHIFSMICPIESNFTCPILMMHINNDGKVQYTQSTKLPNFDIIQNTSKSI